jgi:tetratricopeptide (TPR) repeat protein
MSPKKIFQLKTLLPLFAFGIPFFIYYISLAQTFLPPDGAEFALCIQYLGICHPPGFFPYILLGKLFTLLFPFGSLIYRTNLLSAIYASGTALCIYLTMLRINISKSIAFITALIFAVTSSFWYFSLSTDVFTFATLLLSLTLYFLLSDKISLSFLFLGILTSHFPNSIILLPIFIWYSKKVEHKTVTNLLTYFLIFCLGIFPFIIVLFLRMLQDPTINWGHVTTAQQFINYLERKEFGGIFLINNPLYVFTPANLFSQLYLFLLALVSQFGWILPVIAVFIIVREKLFNNEKIFLLILIFIFLTCINIFSLSSIDPFANPSFQFDKFYLSAFTVATVLFAVGINKVKNIGIKKEFISGTLIIIFLALFFSNWNSHNLSSNYFSKNMIENSLNELPDNALVIVTSNQNYFGSWYEQLIENKYMHMTFVYIPNNTNTDFEKYHPELVSGKPIQTIEARTKLTTTNALKSVLTIIARNPNRPIFIWQGDEIDPSISYFKDLLLPYGLWWKVHYSQENEFKNDVKSKKILSNLKNRLTNFPALTTNQHYLDMNVYTTAFGSTAIELAKKGKYTDATSLFDEALALDPSNPHNTFIVSELTTINEIETIEPTTQNLVSVKDEQTLMQLAQDYYSLGNYPKTIEVYKKILLFDPKNAEIYSNIGAMYATINNKKNGLVYFNKAIKLDPTLTLAIEGKNKLENSQ